MATTIILMQDETRVLNALEYTDNKIELNAKYLYNRIWNKTGKPMKITIEPASKEEISEVIDRHVEEYRKKLEGDHYGKE